jgi:hypothetical protein
MKNKRLFFLLSAAIAIAMIVNSCKKQTQSPIQQLFVGGQWELASVTVTYYTGDQVDSTVVDTTCHMAQYFTFLANNTCTYTNYDCLTQTPAAASWTLTANQLFLQANVVCKDTSSKTGSSMPFSDAQIENLGQYSLILNIGSIQPNYSLTQPRVIYTYGFIRQKLNGSD